MWATVRSLTSNTKLDGKVATTAVLNYEARCFGYDEYEAFAVQVNEFVTEILNQIGPKKGLEAAAKIVASSWCRYITTCIVCSATSSPMFGNDHGEDSVISRADVIWSINNLSKASSLQAMGYSLARVNSWLGRNFNTVEMEAILSPYLSELSESSVSKFCYDCLSLCENQETRLLKCCAMSYEGMLVLFNWIRKMLTLTMKQAESRHLNFKRNILSADMLRAFSWMRVHILNSLHFPLDAQAESNRACDGPRNDNDNYLERKRLKKLATVEKPLPHIPDDILQSHVLPKLPFHSLLRFKCVSRKWQETILWMQKNLFCKQESHDIVQSFGLFNGCKKTLKEIANCDVVKLVVIDTATPMNFCNSSFYAACNGYLCLELSCMDYPGYNFTIGNPVTGEWNLLPSLQLDFPVDIFMGPGLAVDLSKSPPCYKLVILVSGSLHKFYVFSSDTGEWKASHAMLPEFLSNDFSSEIERRGNSVYINGLLYWLSGKNKLYWFDLDRDEANSIAMPYNCEPSFPCVIGSLKAFGGGEMRLTFTFKLDGYQLLICILDGENQWLKFLSIPIISNGDFKPFPYMGGMHQLVFEGERILAYNMRMGKWSLLLEQLGASLLSLDIFAFKMNMSPLPERINL